MTGLDELNMIISLYGTTQEVPQIITKLSRVENRSITNSLALGSIICPRELCCDDIVRYVRAMEKQSGSAISVHSIADGQVEAIEFLVDEDTRHCGEALKDIRLRSGVLLVSITRGSAFSSLSKLALSVSMLAGRLEIFPILVLLSRSTWKR